MVTTEMKRQDNKCSDIVVIVAVGAVAIRAKTFADLKGLLKLSKNNF